MVMRMRAHALRGEKHVPGGIQHFLLSQGKTPAGSASLSNVLGPATWTKWATLFFLTGMFKRLINLSVYSTYRS
jgi:hypothetical protein